jgi:hypothetical protein
VMNMMRIEQTEVLVFEEIEVVGRCRQGSKGWSRPRPTITITSSIPYLFDHIQHVVFDLNMHQLFKILINILAIIERFHSQRVFVSPPHGL